MISNAATQTAQSGIRGRYYTLIVLTIVYSFNLIDRQLLAILQESIKADLAISDSQLGLLTGFAFALFYVTAGIPLARWADVGNRRNIVALSLFVWSFMTAISGMMQNYTQLLLARIGVGVGEAGGSPPSHSMISDLFPPEQRASALGFYSAGVSIGILFGFLFGGWLNEFFGWRVAFMVVGVPGIVLAAVVRFTLKEPARGQSESRSVEGAQASTREVIRLLWKMKSFRHLAIAGALSAFASYAVSIWSASFMIRSYQMGSGELGTWLAIIIGLCGAIGVFGGGALADRLARRDVRWYLWLLIIGGWLAAPFLVGVYLSYTKYLSLGLMIIPAILSNLFVGVTLAVSQSLVGLRMRATTSALLFLVFNLIGLGLGPWLVGMLSDAWQVSHGAESLRQALLVLVPSITLWSTLHYFLSSRHLRADLLCRPD